MPTVASFDDSYQAGLEVESSSIQQADTDSHEESAVSHLDFAGLDSPTKSRWETALSSCESVSAC